MTRTYWPTRCTAPRANRERSRPKPNCSRTHAQSRARGLSSPPTSWPSRAGRWFRNRARRSAAPHGARPRGQGRRRPDSLATPVSTSLLRHGRDDKTRGVGRSKKSTGTPRRGRQPDQFYSVYPAAPDPIFTIIVRSRSALHQSSPASPAVNESARRSCRRPPTELATHSRRPQIARRSHGRPSGPGVIVRSDSSAARAGPTRTGYHPTSRARRQGHPCTELCIRPLVLRSSWHTAGVAVPSRVRHPADLTEPPHRGAGRCRVRRLVRPQQWHEPRQDLPRSDGIQRAVVAALAKCCCVSRVCGGTRVVHTGHTVDYLGILGIAVEQTTPPSAVHRIDRKRPQRRTAHAVGPPARTSRRAARSGPDRARPRNSAEPAQPARIAGV